MDWLTDAGKHHSNGILGFHKLIFLVQERGVGELVITDEISEQTPPPQTKTLHF